MASYPIDNTIRKPKPALKDLDPPSASGSSVKLALPDQTRSGTTIMSEPKNRPPTEAKAKRVAPPMPSLDAARATIHRRRPDMLNVAAMVFFVLAIVAASYPAFRAGPGDGPALLLLIGLAGVAFLGIFAFATSEPRNAPVDEGLHALVDALAEPAAVTTADGRLVSFNAAWRAETGVLRRLPKDGAEGQALYGALASARRNGAGEAKLGRDPAHPAAVSRLGDDKLLVRLTRDEPTREAPELRPPLSAGRVLAAINEQSQAAATSQTRAAASDPLIMPPSTLDAFAAAAPFGAALLEGAEPFEAVILEVNEAMTALTAGRAKPGVIFGQLIEPNSRADARARLNLRRAGPIEVRLALETPGGAHLYVTEAAGRMVAYLLDVSEQKQLEIQLAQVQKMQAIGQLAGGVAHDFNNLLTAIQLRLDELLHRHPVGDPSYDGLNEIRQTATRAADLVRKLLAFSRKSTVQRETLDLGELISEFEVLLRRLLREDVKLSTEHGRDLPLVRADKSQLETAVMNLVVNARDALRSDGAHDGEIPTVSIRTKRLTPGEARALGFPTPAPDGCAFIEVTDNGPGIPPDALVKIFEPFFTTKPVHEGTGLGLATVYGIVKQADGWIHVSSELGKGASFRIFLPIFTPTAAAEIAAQAAQVAAAKAKLKPAARDLSGAGRILFVEDEDAVRGVAARLLRARGYEVIEAADGEEALALAQTHAGQIDLMISDVIMPGLDGPTLLKKARPHLGDIPVMFISGYAEAEFSDLLEGETGVTFLPKPIDIKVLAERVKQQLKP
jgi:two-component system cell cycle sensor histidine kinase/response regulator CckA